MASAFQIQARAAHLQRASELAREAFGHGLDSHEADLAQRHQTSLAWMVILSGIGLGLLAIVVLAV